MRGTNRAYQLIPPDTAFKGDLEIVLSDTLLGWELGRARVLKDMTKGDAWLINSDWTKEKVMQELVVDRLKSIKSLGGYRSKGFGGVDIAVE